MGTKLALSAIALAASTFLAYTAIAQQNVTGTWRWDIIPQGGSAPESVFIVQLRQNGQEVNGSFDCSGCARRDIVNQPLRGTLKGAELKLERPNLSHAFFELTVTGNMMTGTYVGRTNQRYDVRGKKQ